MTQGDDDPELIETRADEHLDIRRLEPFLRERLPGADGPLEVRQFGGGHANLTYLLSFGSVEFVLRRPPLGPVAPSAHDMGREYRVLSRLWEAFPLAPRSYLFCEDRSLIGAPFQIMERRKGVVLRKELPPELVGDGVTKRRIGEMLVDVLADLHLVSREAAGLCDLGHPDGYAGRQLGGWTKRWYAAAHVENKRMDRLIDWLERGLPEPERATLLHNDFKLDNLLVSGDDPARCIAILDWDMCTSGDPMMDLGYLLNQWDEPGDDPDWIEQSTMDTASGGFASRDEVVARYAARTGFSIDDVQWFYAFAAMKFAVIIQQIFIRYHRGQTRDERFATYDRRADVYVDKGCAVAKV